MSAAVPARVPTFQSSFAGFLLGSILGLIGVVVAGYKGTACAQLWSMIGVVTRTMGLFLFAVLSTMHPQTHRVSTPDCHCSVEVPWGMSARPDLHSSAELAYADPNAELYLLSLVESRQDVVFDNPMPYARRVGRALDAETPFVRTEFNGYPAARRVVAQRGTQNGDVNTYLVELVIQTPERFHHVLAWTLMSQRDQDAPKLEAMINSYKVLEPAS